MAIIEELLAPQELIDYTKERKIEGTMGDILFPERKTEALEIKMIKGASNLPISASIHSFDTEAEIGSREGADYSLQDLALMIRKTLEAITVQLRKEFGENYEIWVDEQEQGLKEPCFFVQVIHNSQTPKLAEHYIRSQTFDIIYFPKTRNTFELVEMAERLYPTMEYIEVNGVLVRGKDRHTEIVDNTLHFIVDYDLYLREIKEPDNYMEELKQKGRLG